MEGETVNEGTMDQQPSSAHQKQSSKDAPEPYLDREGGYANESVGKQAELAAMCQQAPLSVHNLPTKQYLEATVTPTVLRALTEVCKARPENPLEFVAYYVLKHNPQRKEKEAGKPIGHKHPEDVAEEKQDAWEEHFKRISLARCDKQSVQNLSFWAINEFWTEGWFE